MLVLVGFVVFILQPRRDGVSFRLGVCLDRPDWSFLSLHNLELDADDQTELLQPILKVSGIPTTEHFDASQAADDVGISAAYHEALELHSNLVGCTRSFASRVD